MRTPQILSSFLPLAVVATASMAHLPTLAQSDQQVERGFQEFMAGDYKAAILTFDRIIQEKPNHAVALMNRCGAFTQLAEATADASYYEKAWNDCNKAIRIDPSLAIAHYNRCSIQLNLGDFSEAEKDCDRAIEKAPGFAPSYLNRCSAKVQLGKYQSALNDCDEALALDGGLAMAHANKCAAK